MSALSVPKPIRQALDEGAVVAISVSGGKDSQALLHLVTTWMQTHGYGGDRALPNQLFAINQMFAIHADLGRAEWPQTSAFVTHLCQRVGIELVVVRREKGDLVERMEERMCKLQGTGKPFWPSSAARYCTSDLKRGPINKLLRGYPHIISAEGIRREESAFRKTKPCWSPRTALVTKTRRALTWNPIIELTLDELRIEHPHWTACGTSQDEINTRRRLYAQGEHEAALNQCPVHPAYIYGNQRLSCALCVLGCRSDLENGVRHNPDLAAHYAELEQRSGFTFKRDLSIAALYEAIHGTAAS